MAKKQVEAAPDSGVSPEQSLSNLENSGFIGKGIAKLIRKVGAGTVDGTMPGSGYAQAIKQQLRMAGGVAPRKKGGKVSKGKSKKPRGVGCAQRGYGKALTGRKK
jgi:hypothetical protein